MKFPVNTYIVAPHTIFLLIVAAFPSSEETVYAVKSHREAEKISWHTEYELEHLGFTSHQPDFAAWAAIKEGDMFHKLARVNEPNSDHYHKVISRVGNTILMSSCPQDREEQKAKADILKQIEELSESINLPTVVSTQMKTAIKGDIVISEEFTAAYNKMMMPSNAFHVASSDWITVHDLALMNWRLVSDE